MIVQPNAQLEIPELWADMKAKGMDRFEILQMLQQTLVAIQTEYNRELCYRLQGVPVTLEPIYAVEPSTLTDEGKQDLTRAIQKFIQNYQSLDPAEIERRLTGVFGIIDGALQKPGQNTRSLEVTLRYTSAVVDMRVQNSPDAFIWLRGYTGRSGGVARLAPRHIRIDYPRLLLLLA